VPLLANPLKSARSAFARAPFFFTDSFTEKKTRKFFAVFCFSFSDSAERRPFPY
jgi:hypothetical protein